MRVVIGAGGLYRPLHPVLDDGAGDLLGQHGSVGDGDLANRAADADDLGQVRVGEHRRKAQDRQRHALDVPRKFHRHVVGQKGRGTQRNRQRPAHQFGRVVRHHPQDFVSLFTVFRRQLALADVAAQLVRDHSAFIGGGAFDQRADIVVGQRRARRRHGRSPLEPPRWAGVLQDRQCLTRLNDCLSVSQTVNRLGSRADNHNRLGCNLASPTLPRPRGVSLAEDELA